MNYVVTLVGYAPPAREDEISFTTALLEEGAEEGGPFTVIQTYVLAPDPDPAHPALRDFTTAVAQYAEGWYRITWRDASNATAPTPPVQHVQAVGTRPSVAEVAAKIRARTKTVGGGEVGTFTADTRPTVDQANELIGDALDEVLGKVHTPEPGSRYERRVRGAVALYAAILIELSYFPEQVGNGKSPAATFETLYTSRIKALIAEGETGEPEGMGDTDAPADASYIFPSGGGIANMRW